MDVQLERVDGVKVCELLRHTVLAGSPLVIFLSSHCEKEAILKGFEAGATDFITKNKPFDPREGLARIRAHLQIRQLQVQLEAANQQLQRANAAKDRILTVTTHDLRSPLTAVRGLTEYLRDGSMGPVTTKQLETLNYLSGSVEAMLILVNDLLDVTTLDVHQIKLECKPLDFVSLLRWVGWAYSPLAARKNLRLQLDIPESGLEIAGDEIRLKRVLENLVTNAIKFSPAGTQIILGARSMGDVVSVWVDDEGPGVPLDEQAKLFTEYGRTSSLPTGGESSTGLGLAICRRIVAAHGGVIIMRNRLKGGAHFEFCLPRVAKPSGVESRAA
jgi:signal transduction histidine kinase